MGWGQGFNAFAQNASQGIMQGMQLQQKREADQADNAFKAQQMSMQERQLAPHLQNFKPSEFASMANTLAKMGVTPDTNLYKRMEESAYDPAVTKGDMYQRLKENLPEYTVEVRNKLASMIAKNADNPETAELKKQKDLLDSLTTPEALVMNLMPKTHESMEYERQAREAAMNKRETTDDIKEYTYAVRTGGFKGSLYDWQMKMKRAGATQVNVGERGLGVLAGEMSKDLVKQRPDVEGAVAGLNNLKEAGKLLDAGMITGTGAEFMVGFGNLLQSRLGIDTGNGAIANTQAYAATMGNQVGQIIKQFGSGTGLSDADREYAEKIVGGKITLNEQAIRKLHAINKKAFTNVINTYNKKATQVMRNPAAQNLPYDARVPYDEVKETKPEVKAVGGFTYKDGKLIPN